MRLLFVMDAYSSMQPDKDTSFAFMRAAQERDHSCFHCQPHQLGTRGKVPYAHVQSIKVTNEAPHVTVGPPEVAEIRSFEAILIRKDPPFDAGYLHLTQLLDLAADDTFIMNEPSALRNANEKLFAFHFAEFMPPSLVSSSTDELLEFVRSVGGRAVVKPLDGAGGAGVMGIEGGGRNSRGVLDYITREGKEPALVQEFQPDVVAGDKRVLLLDGELLGAIRRVPREDDIRANIHVGGRVEASDLSQAELELVRNLAPRLAQAGLYFVGLDLIAEKLIEINVTSPTGIQELARLTDSNPAQEVIKFLESRGR